MKSKYKAKLLLIGILLLAFTLRFHALGEVPLGLNNDETAIGYNAYSILQTGKDEYGVALPLYFKSFGDQKLPVYIYLTSASIKVFGMNEFAVRFPSFFFGSITILTIYYLVLTLSKKESFALLTSLLLAINPWHIFFSRIGFEVNVAISLMAIGTLFFILSVHAKSLNRMFLLISVIAFLLSLYCYNVTRLLSPLVLLSLILFYRKHLQNNDMKFSIFAFCLFLLGMLPFAFSLSGEAGLETQRSVLLIGGERMAKNIEFRSYLLQLPDLITKVFFNNWMLIFWNYLKNLVSFFSVDFFFVNGANHPINGVGNMGMFHLIEFILIPLGIFKAIKERVRFLYPFLFWIVLVILLGSITKELPHPTRTYGIIIPFIIFSAFGLMCIFENLRSKTIYIKRGTYILFLALFSYSLIYFVTSYFFYFPTKYAKTWRSEDKKLAQYVFSVKDRYKKIIVDDNSGLAYTSLFFYGKYPPEKMHESAKFGPNGLLTTLKSVDNIEFRKINWQEDTSSPGTLFITLDNMPSDRQPIKTLLLPTIPVALFYDNKFDRFPVTEVVYRIYKS
jgi:4-amino-4-deoxy-L-arabinose transferase-like glycosyltransferase